MIDLHMHSIFSDGELIPSELVRRAAASGYKGLAITDHADHSNYDFIIPRISQICRKLTETMEMKIIPGIEITHVPPALISELVRESRKLGAAIVVCHGETIVEPVEPGTNLAALEAGVDILAHPGLISEEEVRLAAMNSIFLEISARKGHSLTNGHVAALARKCGARLVLNTDSHAPQDLINSAFAARIAAGAGLSENETALMFGNSEILLERSFGQ
jgi:histidinol phosphatase-like PHP family hydrolase